MWGDLRLESVFQLTRHSGLEPEFKWFGKMSDRRVAILDSGFCRNDEKCKLTTEPET